MNETALSQCAMRSRQSASLRTHTLAGSFFDFAFAFCSYGQLLLTSAAHSQVIYEKSRADLNEKYGQAPRPPHTHVYCGMCLYKNTILNIFGLWS